HERLHAVNEPCNGLNVLGHRHPPLAEIGARQILSRHQSWALVAKIMIQVRFEAQAVTWVTSVQTPTPDKRSPGRRRAPWRCLRPGLAVLPKHDGYGPELACQGTSALSPTFLGCPKEAVTVWLV